MLVGPQHRAVEIVQNAITVRPKKRHIACGGDKLVLKVVIACLGKSRGEADGAAASHGRQFGRDLDHRMPVDPQKGSVRNTRKIGKVAVAGNAVNRLALRMDRPDVTVKTRFQALFDDIFGPPSAKDDNATRTEQSRQVAHQPIPRVGEEDRG